jgi:hypothetical protein
VIFITMLFALAELEAAGDDPGAVAGHDSPTRYSNESQFIVEAIVKDLAEEVFHAKHHQLPSPNSFAVRVVQAADSLTIQPACDIEVALESNRPPVRCPLALRGAIWLPDEYAEVASQLARITGLSASQAAGVFPGRCRP